ncbi:MAG TPA: phosphoribosylformylglycinamidine synthase subunit PurQ [Gemmatimonadales bacterium]|nr:phosphoribosylformylglycinamidine synthase subunit PurQ [Gemmatimonadales bacterium]
MQRVAVVRFPGSNCDFDTLRAATRAGAEAVFVWHRDTDLKGADIVILPGGFSYGDYLRAGAIARFSPVMPAVQRHAAEGGAVFGICNGFQILCEAGLLPGALVRNAGLHFVAKPVDLRIDRTDTVFTSEFRLGERIRLPVSHGEGRYVADEPTLAMLEGEGRVVLRYLPPGAGVEPNPNGSVRDIAGICNPSGTVVGIMPHPDRAWADALGSTDGLRFFTSMAAWQPAASGRSP